MKNIHDGIFGSVMGVGKENAVKLVVDSALALNEFYAERNGVEELVSSKRAEGGFVHKVEVVSEDPSLRNYFEVECTYLEVRVGDGVPHGHLRLRRQQPADHRGKQ